MNRRTFIATSAVGLFAAPLAAEAQAGKVYRIGFLGAASLAQYASHIEAMRQGLRDLGYVEGRNIVIEYRWAEGKYERLPDLAAELVRLKVDLIVTHGTPGAQAAKGATATIPIVMAVVGNPVETGLVASIPRPGGNITGTSMFFPELNAKRLELLKEVVPRIARVGALLNLDNPAHAAVLSAMEEAARTLRLELHRVGVRRPEELDGVIAQLKGRVNGLSIIDDAMLLANAGRIAAVAARHRLPTIGFREYVEAGGLMAYGVNLPQIWRRSMSLVDKILKGARPGDLPIEQATQFELIINAKTAKALGLTLPPSILIRADRVIE
jgi:putative ABC transport system substrate-binding protein